MRDLKAVLETLTDRENRLSINCDIKHREWRNCYTVGGQYIIGMTQENAHKRFDAWSDAIEELEETAQAIRLLNKIIAREAAKEGK